MSNEDFTEEMSDRQWPWFDSQASKEFITSSTFAEMDEDQNGKVCCNVFTIFVLWFLSQVTLEEFTTAILAREQFSKMLTLKIIDIFVEDE